MGSFVFDLLVIYFSNSLWGLYFILGFCTLCLAGVVDLIFSLMEV